MSACRALPGTSPALHRKVHGVVRVLVFSSLALVLVSCQRGTEVEPTATPLAVSGTTVPASQRVRLGPVVWTTGVDPETGKPIDRVESFPRNTKTIYAAFEVMNLPQGSTLTATWRINGRLVEGLESTIQVNEAQPAGWAEFHLDWEGRTMWPVGTLGILITSSTGETVESSVRIEQPD